MNPVRDTTILVLGGHEGWLELPKHNYQLGEKVIARFRWGHNLKTDGLCSRDGLTAWVSTICDKQPCTLVSGDGSFYELSFVPTKIGYAEVIVQHKGVVSVLKDGRHVLGSRRENPDALETLAFTQYAKSYVKIGDNATGDAKLCGGGLDLDLAPLDLDGIRAGHAACFRVLYRGKESDQSELAACGWCAGEYRTYVLSRYGSRVEFVPEAEGHYALIARHKDSSDCVQGVYDKRSYTCVLTFTVW